MNSILVGVTGKGENTAALKFAARQAAAQHAGVTLVHAVPPVLPSMFVTDDSWEYLARTVVADVEEEFRAMTGDTIPVDTVGVEGSPGQVFRDSSKDASLVVLQHRDTSRLYRITTGSTLNAVATHAHCPVVSVPAAAATAERGVVTAGVHEDGGPGEVLEEAFAQASLYGRSLRVVHAYRLPAAYDDLLMHDARWRNEAHAALTAAVDALRARHPDVDVEVGIRHDWPADVLAERARGSDLLVVGRHGKHRLAPTRLGKLTRSLLSHAECPVMVVPIGQRGGHGF